MHHAITFGRVLVDRRILTPVFALALLLTTLLAAAPALAQETGGGPVTATGVLERAAPHGPDPTPVYAITDEEAGTSYELVSGFVDLEQYVGERVTIEGVSVPGPGDPRKPPLLNVTQVRPVGGDGGTEGEATLSFELAVEGESPAGTKFFGVVPAEGCISVPLADPDGDGLYTGSTDVPRFAPGGAPEPVSLPVQIVQADGEMGPCNPTRVIEDFGPVKIDGDKTFTASVSFSEDGGLDNDNGGGSDGTGSEDNSGGTDSGSPGTSGSAGGNFGSGGRTSGGGEASGDNASGGGNAFGPLLSGMKDLPGPLPETGGVPLTLGVVGVLLVAGGLLARKVLR